MKRCFGFLALCLMMPALAFGKGYFITPKVEVAERRLNIAGTTNLPEGSRISITLVGTSVAYNASGDAVVRNGSFNGRMYGPPARIPDGSYTIAFSSLKPGTPTNQWHTAKDMVRGSDKFTVKGGRLGKFDGNTVAAAKEKTLNFAKKLSALEKQGRKMDTVRFSPVLDDMAACTKTMRKLQPVADKYHEEAQAIPLMEARVLFGAAATELSMCVSCTDNAVDHCSRANGYIADGVKSVKSQH